MYKRQSLLNAWPLLPVSYFLQYGSYRIVPRTVGHPPYFQDHHHHEQYYYYYYYCRLPLQYVQTVRAVKPIFTFSRNVMRLKQETAVVFKKKLLIGMLLSQ